MTVLLVLSPPPAQLDTKARIVAVIVTGVLLGVVLELVRRRRLVERYALLWMLAAVALLVLAIWRPSARRRWPTRSAIEVAAERPVPDRASACVFVLLLHFSIATSRLAEETKILAQEVARLDAEARAAREAVANGDGARRRTARRRRRSAADRRARAAPAPRTSRREAAARSSARARRRRRGTASRGRRSAPRANSPAPIARVAWIPRRSRTQPRQPSEARRPRRAASAPNQPPATETGTSASSVASSAGASSASSAAGIGADQRRPAVALQLAPLGRPLVELVVVVDPGGRLDPQPPARRAAAAARGRRPRGRGRTRSAKPPSSLEHRPRDRQAGARDEAGLDRRPVAARRPPGRAALRRRRPRRSR